MMKTALSIIQDVCYRENQPAPTALIGETDPGTLQWLHLLYSVAEDLRQARVWPQQKRKHSFSTAADTTQYKLPADYFSPILATGWNQSQDNALMHVSDSRFNWYLHSGASSSYYYVYRVFGWDQNTSTELGQFEVNPTPSSSQTLSYDYITRHMFLPQNWEPSTAYTTSDYCNVNGNIYHCTSDGTSSADDPPSGTATSGITDGTAEWGYYNTPYEELIADTDLCLFDYDLCKLGLRAKYREVMGGAYENPTSEFRAKIDRAVCRYKGSTRLSLANEKSNPRYHIPYKGWSI